MLSFRNVAIGRVSRGVVWAIAICTMWTIGAGSAAQVHAQTVSKVDVSVGYSYVRTNAPPGDCGCFPMNGGTGSIAYYFKNSFGAVAEISGQEASDVGADAQDLTLISYLFGPRYRWHATRSLVPFGQALFGAVHASEDLAPGTGGNAGSASAFALALGGGVDIKLTRHIALRPVEIDYYYTRFNNGSNNHQNNFRYSASLVYSFGAR